MKKRIFSNRGDQNACLSRICKTVEESIEKNMPFNKKCWIFVKKRIFSHEGWIIRPK